MYTIYTVRYGDTLDSIASMYNTTIDQIKNLNNFNLDNISMGDQIVVPSNQSEVLKTYTVMVGDNLYDISRKNNVDINTILLLNGLNKNDFLYPGQEIVLPSQNGMIYITKDGDTLDKVLDMNNFTIDDMLRLNKNVYLLPEQIIILKD